MLYIAVAAAGLLSRMQGHLRWEHALVMLRDIHDCQASEASKGGKQLYDSILFTVIWVVLACLARMDNVFFRQVRVTQQCLTSPGRSTAELVLQSRVLPRSKAAGFPFNPEALLRQPQLQRHQAGCRFGWSSRFMSIFHPAESLTCLQGAASHEALLCLLAEGYFEVSA